MMLRNREVATTMPDALLCCAHADVPVAAMCVICQDAMNVPSAVATLECGHCFHNTCIISHLRHDGRCPICRNNPAFPDCEQSYDSGYESDELNESRITFREALKIGRQAAKTDARVKKSFATLRKWNDEVKTARKSMRDANDKLRPLEDAIEDKVEAYTNKQWRRFNRNNKIVLETCTNSRKQLGKARGCLASTKLRIAKKHGFVPLYWNRRINDGDDGAGA